MMKRLLDLTIALFGFLGLLPILLFLALLIKFDDSGSVLFIHTRIGRNGRPFRMFKFRSMVEDAEDKGSSITIGNDSRITALGHVIRRYKLDELPQLLNVLNGTMSLVGPRPEVAKFVQCYTPEQRLVLKLKPGITDPASFAFFDESQILSRVADPERFYREQIMAEKIRINLDYAEKANSFKDMILIFATVARALGIRFDIFSWFGIALPNVNFREGL